MKSMNPYKNLMRFLSLILAMIFLSSAAGAVVSIDITEGNVDPLPISIPEFISQGEGQTDQGSLEDLGINIANVVSMDLERSGLFRPLASESFISNPVSADVRPRFANWRANGSQALVVGQVAMEPDGRVRVDFRLWDVFGESQMTGQRYVTPSSNWRRVAHVIADQIYERITGEKGYFDSRIVYIAETGPKDFRTKRLAIMDQDSANHRFLSDGQYLVLTPRFSPTRQEITYLSYFNNQPRVYLYNIDTAKHEVLGDFPGMTFAPRFSPDGNYVVMTFAENGNSDIFIMDLRTRNVRRLTTHAGIDTAPSFSPDGNQIVFESNRGGSQQLYVMNSDGSNIRRISFSSGTGRYGTPVWSPRGDLIAFTKLGDGKFRIGVMRPDGSGERLLTDAWQDEGPTWSPNGRVIIFFRQNRTESSGVGGETSIWSVDLTGYNERRMNTPFDASDPAWSPPLK